MGRLVTRLAALQVSLIQTDIPLNWPDCAGLTLSQPAKLRKAALGLRQRSRRLLAGIRIPARFMRQDFFEFTPFFKPLIAGNHMPSLRSVDEAIRRRFHLIPFSVTIPSAERDPLLSEKLREEWPGILAWMIEGCRKWQAMGLQVPDIVRSTTKSYLDTEDAVGSWIDDCCDRDPQSTETSAAFWASWSAWAKKEGEPEGSRKSLSQKLESKGFRSGRTNKCRTFSGLRIR